MATSLRRVMAVLIAIGVSSLVGAPVVAEVDEEAAERAAREIAAARDRANQAADDYFAAESRLDLLRQNEERLQLELAQLLDEVVDLKRTVEQVAIDRFVSSGSGGIPLLTDLRDPTTQLQGSVLASVVADAGATTLDDYDEAEARLRDKRAELTASQEAVKQLQEDLEQLQADAEAEVARLREIESQRLEDEQVRIALAAQQREEAQRIAEIERRQAEAARAAAAPAADLVTAGSSGGTNSGNRGASGGDAGGRTGGGGAGNDPRAIGVNFLDGGILCPIYGTSSYGDTWGAPRSGGRRHQGVDMIAQNGTPLQAVIGGTTTHRSNRLGGITVFLQGDNGNRYYYAHLSAYEGPPGRVEPGQIIGYVGETGNATGIPHLHFEIRPAGGIPINPYPSVRAAGC